LSIATVVNKTLLENRNRARKQRSAIYEGRARLHDEQSRGSPSSLKDMDSVARPLTPVIADTLDGTHAGSETGRQSADAPAANAIAPDWGNHNHLPDTHRF
jgi:hypothetical protein